MVCYVVPTIAAVAVYFLKTTVTSWRENIYYNWFFMLLAGGALFGLIEHFWNGELFLLGENILMDISLGIIITIGLSIAWVALVTLDKLKYGKNSRLEQ